MKRRQALIVGTGVVAAASGAVVAWRRDGADPGYQDPLWATSFPAPDGTAVSMSRFRGRPLVINFWATWCPPCVKEMPELDRFARAFADQGWQVLGLAIDGPTPVREFLAKVSITFPIGLAGFEGTDLSRRLGNQGGALPFTVAFDRRGEAIQRKLGETSYEQLASWAQKR
jgi:thiol-disulfide isomerase/thioredoxin